VKAAVGMNAQRFLPKLSVFTVRVATSTKASRCRAPARSAPSPGRQSGGF
jgi:hypothetical protein